MMKIFVFKLVWPDVIILAQGIKSILAIKIGIVER